MTIDEIKGLCDNWNELDPEERIIALLEDHCFLTDIKSHSHGDFLEFEFTPSKSGLLSSFIGDFKDIFSEFSLKVGEGETITLEALLQDVTFKAISNRSNLNS